jgi:hypothetical protein
MQLISAPESFHMSSFRKVVLTYMFVGSMAHRGFEYGTSFQFLKKQRTLNLSTSVAHLKQFFSTTRAH